MSKGLPMDQLALPLWSVGRWSFRGSQGRVQEAEERERKEKGLASCCIECTTCVINTVTCGMCGCCVNCAVTVIECTFSVINIVTCGMCACCLWCFIIDDVLSQNSIKTIENDLFMHKILYWNFKIMFIAVECYLGLLRFDSSFNSADDLTLDLYQRV